MGAPKGNQFWKLRSKHGVDKIFTTPEIMWDAACEYFQWCDENPIYEVDYRGKDATEVTLPHRRPYTLIGLCLFLGVNSQYFKTFKFQLRDEDPLCKDFKTIITRIEEIVYNQKFEGAAIGFFNSNLIARDLGLSEKTDVSFDSEKKLNISIDSKEIDLGK